MKKRTCPSCEVDLVPIHVWMTGPLPSNVTTKFHYSVAKPKSGWLDRLGFKKTAGTIQGHHCPECDQVFLFAQPA